MSTPTHGRRRSLTFWLFKPRAHRSEAGGDVEWLLAVPPFHFTVYTSRRGLRHTSGHFWFGPVGVHAFIDKGCLPHRVGFEWGPSL